jgi:hypothetical protein
MQTDDNEVKNFFLSFAEFIKEKQDDNFGCLSNEVVMPDNFSEWKIGFETEELRILKYLIDTLIDYSKISK